MNPGPFRRNLVWQEKQRSLPESVAGGASAVFGQALLLAGGTNWKGDGKRWLDRVDLYDFETGQWRSGPRLPRAYAYGCFATNQCGFEIIGGCDATGSYRDCRQLETGRSSWRTLEDAPQDFIFAAAESWDVGLYVFGGCASDHDLSTTRDTVWMRDSSHRWHTIAALPQGNIFLCAHASIAGRAYCFGECTASHDGGVVNHDDVFAFHYKTHAWTRLHSLPLERFTVGVDRRKLCRRSFSSRKAAHSHSRRVHSSSENAISVRGASAVALEERCIAIIGGYGETFLNTVLIYDLERDLFVEQTPLTVGLLGAQFVTRQGTLYGAGGEDGVRSRSSRLFIGTFTHSSDRLDSTFSFAL